MIAIVFIVGTLLNAVNSGAHTPEQVSASILNQLQHPVISQATVYND